MCWPQQYRQRMDHLVGIIGKLYPSEFLEISRANVSHLNRCIHPPRSRTVDLWSTMIWTEEGYPVTDFEEQFMAKELPIYRLRLRKRNSDPR
jgi:hypothetical protein